MSTMEVIDMDAGEGDEFLEAVLAEPEAKGKAKKSPREEESTVKQVLKRAEKEVKQKSKEEIRAHQAKVERIQRTLNNTRFKTYLEDNDYRYTARELRGMSLAELEELDERIRSCLANKNPAEVITAAHQFGVMMLETTSQRAPFNRYADLTGLSAIAANNDELLDILALLEIDYGMTSILSPEQRYALTMAKLAMTVNSQNQARKMVEAKMAEYQARMNPTPSPSPEMEPEPEPEEEEVQVLSISRLAAAKDEAKTEEGAGLGLGGTESDR